MNLEQALERIAILEDLLREAENRSHAYKQHKMSLKEIIESVGGVVSKQTVAEAKYVQQSLPFPTIGPINSEADLEC